MRVCTKKYSYIASQGVQGPKPLPAAPRTARTPKRMIFLIKNYGFEEVVAEERLLELGVLAGQVLPVGVELNDLLSGHRR